MRFSAERRIIEARHGAVVRPGMVFGRWEYDTGVRDTLSLPLLLTQLAEQGTRVTLHSEPADDWVYSLDVARGLMLLLDLPSGPPEPVYHLSAGRRWSVADWCQRLEQRFAGFSASFVDDPALASAGRGKVARRSPMRIDRLTRDTGYEPQYLAQPAFEDWVAWRQRARGAGWPGC